MVLIFSAASALSAGQPRWTGLSISWEGYDGSLWDLANGSEGVVLQGTGTEGLHDPVLTRYSSVSRAVPGKRLRGWRTESREVFWPLRMSADSPDAFQDTYQRFFASFHPVNPGIWRVGYRGVTRQLELTGQYQQPRTMFEDPLLTGSDVFGIELEAAQPYWSGEPVNRGPWSAPASLDFINGTAPPFNISASTAIGSGTIPNPGDVDAYPVWTVTGPLSGIELGVGSRVIDVPFTVASGSVLVIDTDPRNLTATLNGADVTATLGFQRFASIPTGSEVALHVEATGTGSVKVALTPLYFRAF